MLKMLWDFTGTLVMASIMIGIICFWVAVVKSRMKSYKETHPDRYNKYIKRFKTISIIVLATSSVVGIAQCIYLLLV
jgi:hypothetical protein